MCKGVGWGKKCGKQGQSLDEFGYIRICSLEGLRSPAEAAAQYSTPSSTPDSMDLAVHGWGEAVHGLWGPRVGESCDAA